MTIKKSAKSQGNTKGKKLALKKEKVADLSPKASQADLRAGWGTRATGGWNHNETLVRLVSR